MKSSEAVEILNCTAVDNCALCASNVKHGGECDLQKDFYKAIDMAVDALEKQEKYRWHDLRKNPEDLPAVEERVVLTLDLMREHRNVYGHRAKNGAWVVNGFETSIEVIAWRTDEPFEEDNK